MAESLQEFLAGVGWSHVGLDRQLKKTLDEVDSEHIGKGLYQVLNQSLPGFIAYYNLEGFRAHYRDVRLLVDDILRADNELQGKYDEIGGVGQGFDYYDDHKSFLYDSNYGGVVLVEIVKELVRIAQEYQSHVVGVESGREYDRKRAELERLAKELGVGIAEI